MAFGDFLRLVLKDAFHYRSRLIGSILGALIAVSFITGSIISVDDLSARYFEEELKDLDHHLSYYSWSREISIGIAEQSIKEVKSVDQVSSFASLDIDFHFENLWGLRIVALTSDTAKRYLGNDIPLPSDGRDVIITDTLAKEMDLRIGEEFNITLEEGYIDVYPGKYTDGIEYDFEYPYFDPDNTYVNISLKVLDVVAITENDAYEQYRFHYGSTLFMGIGGMEQFSDRIQNDVRMSGRYVASYSQSLFVRIDPEYFSNLQDPENTRREIRTLSNDISERVFQYGFEEEDNLIGSAYIGYSFWTWLMRIFFIVLSVPLLLISFYLLSAGSKVGMEDRIREIGLLKIKGASSAQVVLMLTVESAVYGFLGGIMGMVTGSFLDVFFTASVWGFDAFGSIIKGNLPIPGTGLIVFSLVVVPVVILLMRVSTTFKLSRVPLLEALGRATIIEKQKGYRITKDLMFLSFTLLIVGLMLYFNEEPPNNFYTGMLYFLLLFTSPITVLFLPFILIFTVSRILVLGFDFTLNGLSHIGKLVISELYPLIRSNLIFHRRRIATLTILVTTVIAFGIMVSSLSASRDDKVIKDVEATLPADLLVVSRGQGWDNELNITGLDDVRWAVPYRYFGDMEIEWSRYERYYTRVLTFDSADYSKRIDIPKWTHLEGKGVSSLDDEGAEVPVLINQAFCNDADLDLGTTFYLKKDLYRNDPYSSDGPYGMSQTQFEVRCRIIGIVSYLPGMRSTLDYSSYEYDDGGYIDPGDMYEEPALYIDTKHIPGNLTPYHKVYLVDAGSDVEGAISSIEALNWTNDKVEVFSRSAEIERLKDDPLFTSVQMLLDMEYLFVVIAVTGGVALFMIVTTSSRRREFAEIIARGSTRKQVLLLVLSEGIMVLMAGLIIGSIVGIIISFAFQHLFTMDIFQVIERIFISSSEDNTVDTGTGIVLPLSMLSLHALAIISVIGASAVTSYLASKVDVASSLRLRTS